MLCLSDGRVFAPWRVSPRVLDQKEDGCVVDLHHFSSGAQSVLAYATVNGALVGWDLRSSSNAWTLRHDLKAGLITSFAVDIHQCWLCIGRELPFRALTGSGCCCQACLLSKLFSFVFIGNFPPCPFIFTPHNYYNTCISIFSLKNKFKSEVKYPVCITIYSLRF